ncbi:MAG: methyltransferase domain-containing protein [Candidatus Tritonobacter lacicola]|nr:methyltransferase domain-containing protein [Candidatus Tritonobacter lacicola]
MLKAYNTISLFSPSWMVKRLGEREYRRFFAAYRPKSVLDVGCGSGEKRSVIPDEICYTGVDHLATLHDTSGIDVFCAAYDLPFQSDSREFVFCTGVLEHLEEPERALREAYRVLEPGGFALYAIPLFWHLHEQPRDFYRYTKHGISYLFTKVGYEIVEIKPLSGFWVTFGSELNYYLNSLFRGFSNYLVKPLIAASNLVFLALNFIDTRIHKATEKWTWMYMVVARKNKCR